MPLRGPAPKPTALRIIQGNPGKRALPKNEPAPPAADITDVPKLLTRGAKAHWPDVAKMLRDAQVLTVMDVPTLVLYCEMYAVWIAARDNMDSDTTITGAMGNRIVNPEFRVMSKAHDHMMAIMREFGMTPSSRTRVKTTGPEKPPQNKWGACRA